VTATDNQVKIAMKELHKGRTQNQAAAKANLRSRQTVAKYAHGQGPVHEPRVYRTRPDPFDADWPEVQAFLEAAPELEAKVLFTWLCEQHTERYQEGQLRTFQRRVTTWRALYGSQLLTLPQVHLPGEVLQTDGTWMNTLGITLAGQPFPHLFIHCVLPYSNWEWGRVAQSESLLAIQLGLYSTLEQLGYVPRIHQTDNSTAATHELGPQRGPGREFNAAYLELLAALTMEPRTIHLESPNENGDIEAANGSFKRAVAQHLLLRGQRDFATVEQYEAWLATILVRRNQLRTARLAEEQAVMRPLARTLPPARREWRLPVSRSGTVRILNNVYSVASGLAGREVTARASEWQIEIWYANQCIERFARLTGTHGHQINFRHVIDSLLRKPGGFRAYRYRDDLFPTAVFRRAWEALCARLSARQADLTYLRILKLAAMNLSSDVASVLEALLSGADPAGWDDRTVAARLRPEAVQMGTVALDVESGTIDLQAYDELLALYEEDPQEAHHDSA
jgi:hypothetical protein